MSATPSYVRSTIALFSLAVMAAPAMHAQVLPLEFSGGNGTSAVDQYRGIAGSGWNTAWLTGSGSGVSSFTGDVVNTNPVYTGGGNYLSMQYNVTGTSSNATQYVRLSRQISSSAISLSSPVTYTFTLRPDSPVSNNNEIFTIFSATAATQNTAASDTWRISAAGGGWVLANGDVPTDSVSVGLLGAANFMSGVAFKFTIVSDPSTRTYVATIQNLTNNQSFTSNPLAWRSGAGATENTYLNFISASGSSTANTFGYSLDNVTVVPEPGTIALATLGGLSLLVALRRRSC